MTRAEHAAIMALDATVERSTTTTIRAMLAEIALFAMVVS